MTKNLLIYLPIIIFGLVLGACTVHTNDTSQEVNAGAEILQNESLQNFNTEKEARFSNCIRHEKRNYSDALQTISALGETIVLVGEAHGNRNSIEFVENYVLESLNTKKSVLLAIEVPEESGFQFDQAWQGEINIQTVWENLAQSSFWGKYRDGRQSCGLALMLTDLIGANVTDRVELLTISLTVEDAEQGKLKGHAMAEQLAKAYAKYEEPNEVAVIALTGRKYQRLSSRIKIADQSTMCGKLKQIENAEVFCVGTVGDSLPKLETPCVKNEAFDIISPKELVDSTFYADFDGVLTSASYCADFTPLAVE